MRRNPKIAPLVAVLISAVGVSPCDGGIEARITDLQSAPTLTGKMTVVGDWLELEDPAELRLLLVNDRRLPENLRFSAYRALLDRWAQLEPEQALLFAADDEDDNRREDGLRLVCERWAMTDPGAPVAAAEKIASRQKRRQLLEEAILVLAQSDAARAFELTVERELQFDAPGMMRVVFQNWVEQDPAAANSNLKGIKPHHAHVCANAGYQRGMRDKHGIDAAIGKLAEEGKISRARELLEELARKDPDAAARHPEFANAGSNTKAIYLRALASRDLDAALAWLDQQPARALGSQLMILATEAAGSQPELATRLLERVAVQSPAAKVTLSKANALLLARAWSTDLPAALERIAALGDERLRRPLGAALADHLAAHDPPAYFAHFETLVTLPAPLEDGLSRARAYRAKEHYESQLRELRSQMSNAAEDLDRFGLGPEAAARLVLGTPKVLRGNAISAVMLDWADSQPEIAAAFFDEHFVTEELEDGDSNTLRQIAYRWAKRDAPTAVKWSLSHRGLGRRFSYGMNYLLTTWARLDAVAAGEWLAADFDSIPDSAQSEAITGLTEVLAEIDSAAALAWMPRIENEKTRGRESSRILDRWLRRDPNALAAALEQGIVGLGEEEAKLWGERAAAQMALFKAFEAGN